MSSFDAPGRVDRPAPNINVPKPGLEQAPQAFAGQAGATSGGGWGNFEQWMGKENFRKFQENICNAIAQQISHDRKRQKEASDRLKKAETGEDMYS